MTRRGERSTQNVRARDLNWADDDEPIGQVADDGMWNGGLPPAPESKRPALLASAVSRQTRESGTWSRLDSTGRGYPYVLFSPDYCLLDPDERYTLETTDGSYRQTLTVAEARRSKQGQLVLWFPLPPKGKRCNLKCEPPEGEEGESYYIFRDEPLTYCE